MSWNVSDKFFEFCEHKGRAESQVLAEVIPKLF